MGNTIDEAIENIVLNVLNPHNIAYQSTQLIARYPAKLRGRDFHRIPDGMRCQISYTDNPQDINIVLGYYEHNRTAMCWLIGKVWPDTNTTYDILDVGFDPAKDAVIAREWKRHQPGADDAIWDLLGLTIEIKLWDVGQQEGPHHTVALPLGLPGYTAVMMLRRLAARAQDNVHDITRYTIERISKEDPVGNYTGLHYLQEGNDHTQGVITWQMYEDGWKAFARGNDKPIYESGSLVPPSGSTHAFVWRLLLAGNEEKNE